MYGISTAVLLGCLGVSTTSAKITGSYPVLLTTTSGAPQPSGAGTLLSNYPECAQICGRNYGSLGDRTDIDFDCGPVNRGKISGCEALVCDDADYLVVERLAIDRCGAYYETQSSASAAASSAIASGTAEALAALATRDPTTLEAYPPCSAAGIPAVLAANVSNCLTLANRECICQCPIVYDDHVAEERAACSQDEYNLILHLVDSLCAPVGGLARRYEACHPLGEDIGTVSPTGTVTAPTATPSPFTDGVVRNAAKIICNFAQSSPHQQPQQGPRIRAVRTRHKH